MPFPTDEKLMALANELMAQFDAIFGLHPGFRPAHAKGVLLSGTFVPTAEAAALSSAPHFARQSTPVVVRFSDSTGVPVIPDTDPNASPRGIAIRFQLAERTHTDIIGHSTDGFPTHTGDEFLEFLRALASSDMKAPSDPANPKPIEKFLHGHPAALAFVQTPKPVPSSLARDTYFGVSAFRFISADGKVKYGRYRIVPAAGNDYLDAAALTSKGPNFLFEEIVQRVASSPVTFKVVLQVAEDGDVTDDATVHWPNERPLVELGTVTLTAPVANDAAEQQRIIMDPIPRVTGIEPSDDPLLEVRAALYLLTGRRRRTAHA